MRVKLSGLFAVFALIAAFGLALVGPGAVSAASGGGADSVRIPINVVNDCNTYGSNTFCVTIKGEYHYVSTPSDGLNVSINATVSGTVTDNATGAVVTQFSESIHEQIHTKAGAFQVFSLHVKASVTAGGSTCSITLNFHEANGAVQYDNFTTTC